MCNRKRARAAYTAARRHLRHGKIDDGLRKLGHAIKLAPDYPKPYYLRGAVRFERGDLDGALADLDETIRLDPARISAYNMRAAVKQARDDLIGAFDDLTAALKRDEQSARTWFNRGQLAYDAEDYEVALNDFDAYCELCPEDPDGFHHRGLSLYCLGKDAEALEDIDRALALDPELAEAYYDRANVRLELGDVAGARADFETCLERAPGSWPVSQREMIEECIAETLEAEAAPAEPEEIAAESSEAELEIDVPAESDEAFDETTSGDDADDSPHDDSPDDASASEPELLEPVSASEPDLEPVPVAVPRPDFGPDFEPHDFDASDDDDDEPAKGFAPADEERAAAPAPNAPFAELSLALPASDFEIADELASDAPPEPALALDAVADDDAAPDADVARGEELGSAAPSDELAPTTTRPFALTWKRLAGEPLVALGTLSGTLQGEAAVTDLRRQMRRRRRRGIVRLLLDARDLDYASGDGIGTLVAQAARLADVGGGLAVVGAPAALRASVEAAELTGVFSFHGTRRAAVAALRRLGSEMAIG